jgi:hypothetical protein
MSNIPVVLSFNSGTNYQREGVLRPNLLVQMSAGKVNEYYLKLPHSSIIDDCSSLISSGVVLLSADTEKLVKLK